MKPPMTILSCPIGENEASPLPLKEGFPVPTVPKQYII